MTTTHSAFDELKANWRNHGREEGLREGLREGLAPLLRLFARKLGRPLSEQEEATMCARLATHGADRLGDVALDLDGAALAAWLADPNAR